MVENCISTLSLRFFQTSSTNRFMKEACTDPGSILAYRDRQVAADLLAAAILHLDFFSWLNCEGEASTAKMCAQFGFFERPVDVLLTLCRSNGYILTDEAGNHQVTQIARDHLVSDSPWFLGPYYSPLKDSPFVLDFLQILKTGKPANWRSQKDGADWHNSMLNEEFARNFTALMHCRGLAFGQTLAKELAGDLSHSKCLLDVGGGSGVYAQAFVREMPNLNANVLEQAPVDQIARESIFQAGLGSRIEVTTGNMFDAEWPGHCDVHLLSNLLHDWDFPEISKIIQKSASTIEKGGRLVIHQAFLNDEKSGPIEAAEYSTLLMHITRGRCYSRAELIPILQEAGFRIEKRGSTLANRGYLTATR